MECVATADPITNTPITFLGDLYAFGADIRDSALDKGSGGSEDSEQSPVHAEIADAFGQMRDPYSNDLLAARWNEAIAVIRKRLFSPLAAQDIALGVGGGPQVQ